MPLYRNSSGAIIFADADKSWHMNSKDDFSGKLFSAPALEENAAGEPPRCGWCPPPSSRGMVSKDAFVKAISTLLPDCDQDWSELCATLAESKDDLIYREPTGTSFQEEWSKRHSDVDADAIWNQAVALMQQEYFSKHSLGGQVEVIETPHPYPPKSDQWKRKVTLAGAKSLSIHLSSKCKTYDSCACLSISTGGHNRHAAGPGARVQIHPPGRSSISGTVKEAPDGTAWMVSPDDSGWPWMKFGMDDMDDHILVPCLEEVPTLVTVHFGDGAPVRHEIQRFVLIPSCSSALCHFSLPDTGPAQKAGVQKSWLLDLEGTLFGESKEKITGTPAGFTSLDAAMESPEELQNSYKIF
jgi:hypothetical protein